MAKKILLAPIDPVHDIGLKIIKRGLDEAGYDTLLLPPDLPIEEIIQAAVKENVDTVMVSRTLGYGVAELLSKFIDYADAVGLRDKVKIAIGGMAPGIRMIRATVMQIRSQEYVEAAKATGSGHFKIIFHEIMPNVLSPLIVDATMRIGGNILQISGLSFIGLGVQPPTSEWGSIMSAGQEFITSYWPMITFPGIAIMLTVFAFNVMGDGLRDALDPRLKQ